MAKSQDAKKSVKKEPAKTPKEKKQEKRLKKAQKQQILFVFIALNLLIKNE